MNRNPKHTRVRDKEGSRPAEGNRCMDESISGVFRFNNEYLPLMRKYMWRFIKKYIVINYGYRLAAISAE
jgi:hypothetical protein